MKNLPVLLVVGVLFFSIFWPLLKIDMVKGLPPRSIKIMDSVTGLNSTTVGNSSLPLPPGGIPFTLNISLIGETTDLAAWQVGITFDNNSLRCTKLSIPESDPNYVFHGLSEIKVTDFSDAAQNGTYNGGIPEILAGAALLDVNNAVSVNNSLLCTMNFTAFNVGKESKTTIMFWPYNPATDTFLWDRNGVDIPFGNESFSVNILSAGTQTYGLTASTVGQGIINLNSTGPYHYGDVVQLTPVPSSGWSFDHWSGNLSGSMNPATLVITGNMSVTATFMQNVYFLNLNIVGNGVVNLNSSGPYYYGDSVQLTAVPVIGWSFSNWSGDLHGSANPATLAINGNKTVTATFAQNVYTLTVTINGSGHVALNNSGPYHYGDVVQLTATPSIGWSFDHWTGNLVGPANPITIVIDQNEGVTATFTRNVYTLAVNIMGNGAVNLNNSGPYFYGDVVELTAVPGIGWSFDHWSGDLTGLMNPATIFVDGDKAVTATFTRNTYTLTVSIVGVGTVNRNNSGPYYYGDVVELTAVPSVGWIFDSWSGNLTSSTNPTTILIDKNKEATATFTHIIYNLTMNIIGNGIVNRNNSGPYYYGDAVQLTATPALGWVFDHWTQDLAGSTNPEILFIDGNKIVNATFTEGVHNIAVTGLNPYKVVVGRGYMCNLTVIVENHGVSAETFNLTLYANLTVIAIIPNIMLPAAGLITQAVVWNTTDYPYGNYNISAVADIVPGETNFEDNTYVYPMQVHVGVSGDVSSPVLGVYDKTVNMRDIQYLILLFNTNPSSPNWNPNADINNDGTVNMRDIQIAILYFNQHE